MKISKFAIVSAVVFLHLAAISLMILQPGCKSSSSTKTAGAPDAAPAPAEAANATAMLPAPPSTPAFVPPSRPETPVVPVTIATLGGNEPLSTNGINAVGPAQPSAPEVTYSVKSKDNMTSIAKANGVSLHDLEAANPKINPNKMKVGDILTIPASSAPAPAAGAATSATEVSSDMRTHKVVSGESLTSIARKEGTTIAALRAANNLKSDSIIKVGQELKIPADAGAAATPSAAASTATASSGASAPAASSTATAGADEYVVKSGDSPDSIAKKFGVKTADLMTLNNISNPLRMQIGQKLKLPPNAKTAAATASAPVADTSTPAPVAPSPATVSPAPVPSALMAPTAPSPTAPPPTAGPTDMVAVPVVPVSQ